MKRPCGRSGLRYRTFDRVVPLCAVLLGVLAPGLHGQAPPRMRSQTLAPYWYDGTPAVHPRPNGDTGLAAVATRPGVPTAAPAAFGKVVLGSTLGGLVGGLFTGGTLAFTGWGLSGQSGTVATAMAYVGGIPGVPAGAAVGAAVATRGTDRQLGLAGMLAASALGGLAGLIVWDNMPGEMIPDHHDAEWRRGVAAAIATDVLVTSIVAYAF